MVAVHFCENYGTKLFLSFGRFPDVVGVYGGTFDDPNWFERSAKNSRHIFLSAAQHCTVIPAGIDCFDGHATTNDGKPNTPTVSNEHRTIR